MDSNTSRSRSLRIGQGIDIHPLVAGRPFVLGGVTIPHTLGLDGHSDADALLHAITDAVLGATGRGDIGTYFPNTDPSWKDARSSELLKIVMGEVCDQGWQVINVDCTVLAEAPRITPHVAAMKAIIAPLLRIELDGCAIKASTTEQLGFVGRREGVMAFAVVLMERVLRV